jgi:beta-ribofuranosylaminobenzene 5'-phosphate synthase
MTTGHHDEQAVFVEAAARLHFGVLDLRGGLGRWFGGLGASAPGPTLLVSSAIADSLDVGGEQSDRAADFAQRFLRHYGIDRGAKVHVHRALPPHKGLGSGTQLALAVAKALAEVHGITADASELSSVVSRGCRSAVGTWTFAGGGLVVEGGRRQGRADCGPLLTRLPFPTSWRCLVAVPNGDPGVSGGDEASAFEQLPSPSERDVARVAHVVLMALLPALADGDLATFGRALSEIQETTGRWFAPVQGGTFAPGPSEELVRLLNEWGVFGVGQSSWGPTVYGIVEGEENGQRIAERLRAAVGTTGTVFEGPFRTEGARVWRESPRRPKGLHYT